MFDRKTIKQKSKKQLSGKFAIAVLPAILFGILNFLISITAEKVKFTPFLQTLVSIFYFFVTSIFSFALVCFYKKFENNQTIKFSDFTESLNCIKPAILSRLWNSLFFLLWTLLFFIPYFIIISIIFANAVIKTFGIEFLQNQTFEFTPLLEQMISQGIASAITLGAFMFLGFIAILIALTIKYIQYSMTKYILSENTNLSVKKALRLSIELSKGNKSNLFTLLLSFLGWFLIPVIIGIIFTRLEIFTHAKSITSLAIGLATCFFVPYLSTSFINAYKSIKQDAIQSGKLKEEDFQ